jgi:hypothetical protein
MEKIKNPQYPSLKEFLGTPFLFKQRIFPAGIFSTQEETYGESPHTFPF